MTAPPLSGFVAAISGDADAALTIVSDYANLLATRLGAAIGTMNKPDRSRILDTLVTVDHLPGGALAAVTWPPVSSYLLGRHTNQPTADELATQMRVGAATRLGTDPHIAVDPSWLRGYGPGEFVEVDSRPTLRPGLELLSHYAADTLHLVRICTRVVVLKQTASLESKGSWSTDELIGCTVLINVQRDAEPDWLAESLLHEAVHHCQGMFEMARPFIRDSQLVKRRDRYSSPWTGAALTAKSLLAACFVWFALAKFWARAESSRRSALDRAVRGFIVGDPASMIARFAETLDPDILDVITEMQNDVRCRYGPAAI